VVEAVHHHRVASEEAVLVLVGVLAENHERNGLVVSVGHDLGDNPRPAQWLTAVGLDVVTGIPKRDAIAKLNRNNNSDCEIRKEFLYYNAPVPARTQQFHFLH